MGFLAALLSALLALAPDWTPWTTDEANDAETAGITIALEEPSDKADGELPAIFGADDPRRPLVVIDPGHGGRDPGATSPYGEERYEKDVTLALARAMRDEIAASGRVRVALTRDDDRYIDLRDRYRIARRLGADLFISVHADAAPHNDDAHGATIYTLSEVASDREAALLAARENRSGLIEGAELGADKGVDRILIDLAQRESMDASAEFARLLEREASPYFPFRPDYHRFASLIVLKAPDIPSILFESGYITNEWDMAYIHSAEGQKQIATGMRRAIEAHFAREIVASRS
jgi:N-acetylmuramoyl-L-alanine amidase